MNARHHDVVDTYAPDNGDETYRVEHYDLDLTYRPMSNRLDGVARIDLRVAEDLDRVTFDLAGLGVTKVSVSGAKLKRFAHRQRKLVVSFGQVLRSGSRIRVTVSYSGRPRPVRTVWGNLGWEELREGALVAGQPIGAPTWFPCNDRPSDKATYRVAVTADRPFAVVGNGKLVETRRKASATTWVYEQPEPMATYLATVQIGNYTVRDLGSAGKVPLRVARPDELADRVAKDFGRQDRMMRLFVDRFGRYPFASYTAVITADPLEIPLEAQGLSIFGSNHADGKRTYERLVAHELAHQWFGNSLSVARWSDVWLNEGFACYAEWLWSEQADGPSAHALAERYWARLHDSPHDLVLADPGAERMFDDRVYKRGALALHALRLDAGDDDFFGMLRGWATKHRYGSVTTEHFVQHVTSTLGRPAAASLDEWVRHKRLPRLPTGAGSR